MENKTDDIDLKSLEKTIKARLENELAQWFLAQCRNTTERFYLYYIESNACHNGGFTFCMNKPANPEYKLAWSEAVHRGKTIEENFRFFLPIIRRLPILPL